jgi:hypothetical protein
MNEAIEQLTILNNHMRAGVQLLEAIHDMIAEAAVEPGTDGNYYIDDDGNIEAPDFNYDGDPDD